MDVLIHHSGLDRTVAVPAVAAPAWAASGWEIATDEQAATFRKVGVEEELADAKAAEIEVAEGALAEINPSPAPGDTDAKAAHAGAVETATTNKEQKS